MDNGFEVEKEKPVTKGGLPGFSGLTPAEQNKQLRKMYRDVFATPAGKIVLCSILEDLKYFSVCNNDTDRVLNNYGKYLISDRLGIKDNYKILDAITSI